MPAIISQQPWWDHMWGPTSGWGWIGMFLMMLFWLVVLVVVVWAVIRLTQGRSLVGSGPAGSRGGNAAEEILNERYARGEIDRETYLRMLDDIRRGPAPR